MKNPQKNMISCVVGVAAAVFSNASFANPSKLGILIGSYGDVDQQSEIKELVINTLTDRDVLPLPGYLSKVIAELGYRMKNAELVKEYQAIGGKSGMRQKTQDQADLVAREIEGLGYQAKGYSGFTMTFPYVRDTLKQVQADGVEKLVVFYEGAQYSQVTAYILFREVEEYLEQHPEWRVEVVGVKSFTEDMRFRRLVVENIKNTWDRSYPGAAAEDVCLFLPMHGNVMSWIEKGDPYLDQVMSVVEYVKTEFPNTDVIYGFQNHDELPLIKWTEPQHERAIDSLVSKPCRKVLSSGQISFTVDSLETLYDHGIAEPEYLKEASQKIGVKKEFSLVPMFNGQKEFVSLLSSLAVEALDGQGDVISLGVGELKKLDLEP